MSGTERAEVAVIGGGPAGLAAAETIAAGGAAVTVYDRMPSVGRKLLMAGRGGLNLTHSEPLDRFLGRYGRAAGRLGAAIEAYPPDRLRDWADSLGEPTVVGTSGRVFPKSFKASPLLRAWLRRLDGLGVRLRTRTRWIGFSDDGGLVLDGPGGRETIRPDAAVLALGGASWPRLGSDATWVGAFEAAGIPVAPLVPANCGFAVAWSEHFRDRFQGEPLKRVAIRFGDTAVRGEAVVTAEGLEGGALYALSAPIRAALGHGPVEIGVDLKPDAAAGAIAAAIARTRKGDSLANRLRKGAGLAPVAVGLMREGHGRDLPADPETLARMIKAVPIRLLAVRPIGKAISTAGGVALDAVDDHFMLRARPGVFVAGEMLDWEAPTGGYLLQAAFATGVAAGRGVLEHLAGRDGAMVR